MKIELKRILWVCDVLQVEEEEEEAKVDRARHRWIEIKMWREKPKESTQVDEHWF